MQKILSFTFLLIVVNLLSNPFTVNAFPAKYLKPQNTLIKTEVDKLAIKLVKKNKLQENIIDISHSPIELGFISSTFGMRKDPIDGVRRMHQGIDIAAQPGSLIKPIGSGEVIYSGYKSGFGNTVEIKHGKTVVTRYAHLKSFLVDVGQKVETTDTIGLVGNTGRSTGPHLHLEVLFNNKQVNPKVFLVNKFPSRAVYYAKINEANNKAKFAYQFEDTSLDQNSDSIKESLYVSADGYDIFTNVTQLDYKDYVETLDGLYGLSAPNSY